MGCIFADGLANQPTALLVGTTAAQQCFSFKPNSSQTWFFCVQQPPVNTNTYSISRCCIITSWTFPKKRRDTHECNCQRRHFFIPCCVYIPAEPPLMGLESLKMCFCRPGKLLARRMCRDLCIFDAAWGGVELWIGCMTYLESRGIPTTRHATNLSLTLCMRVSEGCMQSVLLRMSCFAC